MQILPQVDDAVRVHEVEIIGVVASYFTVSENGIGTFFIMYEGSRPVLNRVIEVLLKVCKDLISITGKVPAEAEGM